MNIIVRSDAKDPKIGRLKIGEKQFYCALGRNGISIKKREGDGHTPSGVFRLRRVLYRADRHEYINTQLKTHIIHKEHGWCDSPGNKLYNCLVTLPYLASAEKLWRHDRIYDIIIVLGYNDKPVINGLGSAIFIHIKKDNYSPTEGCISLATKDLLAVLSMCTETSKVTIMDPHDHQI